MLVSLCKRCLVRWLVRGCRRDLIPRKFCNRSSAAQINGENGSLSHGSPGGETGHEMVDERGVCVEPADQQIVRAAVIGAPNAGKSTLINQLLGHKVFAVSPKVHTTRRRAAGVFTEGNTQVVLLDTPGMVPHQLGRKLRLSRQFLSGPHRSLMEAEVVVVIVDVSNKRTRGTMDPSILHALRSHAHIPSVLVLNKVDLLRHKHVLLYVAEALAGVAEREQQVKKILGQSSRSSMTKDAGLEAGGGRNGKVDFRPQEWEQDGFLATGEDDKSEVPLPLRGKGEGSSWSAFKEVFMVSALTGDGVEELKQFLLCCAKPGVWEYSMSDYTDQPALVLVEDTVREKLFLHLHKEIPYLVTQDNIVWERNGEGVLVIHQNLTCKSNSQASIVIGPAGRTIQAITAEAKEDLEALLKCPVELTLNVRTSKK